MKTYPESNQLITPTTELGKGGEATVYNIAEHEDMVAKIYHNPTTMREAKLQAMLANPPEQPKGYTSIAWPTVLLYQQQAKIYTATAANGAETVNKGEFVGFLMPKVNEAVSLFNVYNPVMRAKLPYSFDWRALHRTAYNLCAVVEAIHAKGYVVGDINESNILVNREALVTIVDCDSFQVKDEQGAVHRCPVGKPEYTPPEMQGVSLTEVDQTIAHDLFGLGVLLFQLLMNGYHPFAGVLQSGVSVGRVDLFAVREGIFPYSGNPAMLPPPAAPLFTWLYPELQALFNRTFVAGHVESNQRATAAQWQKRLYQAEEALQICQLNDEHIYTVHQETCPHCEQEIARAAQQSGTSADHWFTPFLEGIQAYEAGNALTVIEKMTLVLARNGQASGAYAYRAWAYHQEGHYQPAITDAQKAIERDANNVLAYFILGKCYYEQQAYQDAVVAFSQAIEHGYQPVGQPYQYRAMANQKLLRPIDMARDFLVSVAQDAKHELLQALGQTNPGKKQYQQLMYTQGIKAYKKKDYQAVIQAMSNAIKNGMKTVETYSYRGWGYAQQQDYQTAMDNYLMALRRKRSLQLPSPNVYQVIYRQGEQAYQQGDVQTVLATMTALINFEKQVRRDTKLQNTIPSIYLGYIYRGWAYYQQSNYNAATMDIWRAISLRAFNVPLLAYYVLGASYNRQQAYHKAFLPLLAASFFKKQQREVYWEQTIVFEKFGLFSLAKRDLERYLALETDSNRQQQAQQRLTEMEHLAKRPISERLKWIVSNWRR